MPRKPRSEIYSAIGLQKQGKNIFYRDFLYHLRHSTDRSASRPASGHGDARLRPAVVPVRLQGDQDFYPPQKDTTRELIKASTCSSNSTTASAAWPTRWSTPTSPSRWRALARTGGRTRALLPSLLERDGDALVIRHVYIERRMIPLNIYLHDATRADRAQMPSSSTATPSRTWSRPTSSPATCCGRTSASRATARSCSTTTTRSSTLTDCNFRKVPAPRNEEERCRARSGTASARRTCSPRPSALPARQSERARGVRETSWRPARPGVLAGAQGAHQGRPRARRLSVRHAQAASAPARP